MSTKNIKVRFNLGKGPRFRMWKITYPNGLVIFRDPNQVQLKLKNCCLVNNRKQSEQIFNGAHKRVCAWVLCENIEILQNESFDVTNATEIRFNPRIKPNWLIGGLNSDGASISTIVSNKNKLFLFSK